jgi:hypothetical protein
MTSTFNGRKSGYNSFNVSEGLNRALSPVGSRQVKPGSASDDLLLINSPDAI